MEEKNWMALLAGQLARSQTEKLEYELLAVSGRTEGYGLTLTEEDAKTLAAARNTTLRTERRLEFGASVLPKLAEAFCDSAYITQDEYAEMLMRLQEIFFAYKNEMMDEISDDELITFMREQFDGVCCGDPDYLEGTCLEIFAEAIRAGYDGFRESQGAGEFGKFDPVKRWDHELYLEVLRELAWG